MFKKISQNFVKFPLKFCLISQILVHSLWHVCTYINFDPLKPHFYIVKLGFTGVYIIFFYFCSKNRDGVYSLESPRRGGSEEYPNLCFEQKDGKYQNFYLKTFSFWW